MEAVRPFIFGGVIGVIFALLSQPVPAPSTVAGIAGLLGLFAGWRVQQAVRAAVANRRLSTSTRRDSDAY